MTVIDPTRRGLLGALLGLAFGWELIEALSASSPIFTSSPVGGAFGEAWPAVRLALHAIACAAALVGVGGLLNKSYRRIWPVVVGTAGVTVHVLGSGLQLAAIRAAEAQGSLTQESAKGLLITITVTSLIGIVLPLAVLMLGLKTPATDDPVPKLPLFAGAAALVVFGGLGYRAFVAPETALATLLLTGDKDERFSAAVRLAERKATTIPALDALAQALTSDDDKLARAASLALKIAGPNAIPPARRSLLATSPVVRLRAIEILRVVGQRNDEAKPECAEALSTAVSSEDERVQIASIEALRRLGSPGENALKDAYKKNASASVRAILEPVLLSLGDEAKAMVHRNRLSSDDATARFVAARALMRLGDASAGAAGDLVGRIIGVDEPQVKTAAADALRAIGAPAHASIDRALATATEDQGALLRYARGEGESVRTASASGLIPAGADEVVFMRRLIDEKSVTVAQVPALAALIADTGTPSTVRMLAATALIPLGVKASDATFVLDKARLELDMQVAQAATNAVLAVAPVRTADIAADLASPHEMRRLIAARALRHVTLARKEVATSLSLALVDEADSVRTAAAESLALFGKHAAHVLGALESAKDDPNAAVRREAEKAHRAIMDAI